MLRPQTARPLVCALRRRQARTCQRRYFSGILVMRPSGSHTPSGRVVPMSPTLMADICTAGTAAPCSSGAAPWKPRVAEARERAMTVTASQNTREHHERRVRGCLQAHRAQRGSRGASSIVIFLRLKPRPHGGHSGERDVEALCLARPLPGVTPMPSGHGRQARRRAPFRDRHNAFAPRSGRRSGADGDEGRGVVLLFDQGPT